MSDLQSYLANNQDHPWAPAKRCFVIAPHDVNPVVPMPKTIVAGDDGTITLRGRDDEADVAHPVVKGQQIPVHVRFVRATGTDVPVIGYA